MMKQLEISFRNDQSWKLTFHFQYINASFDFAAVPQFYAWRDGFGWLNFPDKFILLSQIGCSDSETLFRKLLNSGSEYSHKMVFYRHKPMPPFHILVWECSINQLKSIFNKR